MDSSICTEQHLKITNEYFINPQKSVERISKWINKRIHLAHPRVQLLAFLKHRYTFLSYTAAIEKKCAKYIITPNSKDFDFTLGEARLILNVSSKTLKAWVDKNLREAGQRNYRYGCYSSFILENFLLYKTDQPYLHPAVSGGVLKSMLTLNEAIIDVKQS